MKTSNLLLDKTTMRVHQIVYTEWKLIYQSADKIGILFFNISQKQNIGRTFPSEDVKLAQEK